MLNFLKVNVQSMFWVHCTGPHGEVLKIQFTEKPTTNNVKENVSMYTGVKTSSIKLWSRGTEIRSEEFDIEPEEIYQIDYVCNNVSFIRINFENMITNIAQTFFFDITVKMSLIKNWLMKESAPQAELEIYHNDTMLTNDDENARNYEFQTLKYKILSPGVKFSNKRKSGQVDVVSVTSYDTLNDYAVHLTGGHPDRVIFEVSGSQIDKMTKMSDLLKQHDPIRVSVVLDLMFPDGSKIPVKMDRYATIFDLCTRIQAIFVAVVQDVKMADNKILTKDTCISTIKDFSLVIVLDNPRGHLLTFARDKHHFRVWIAEGENVEVALSKIVSLSIFKGIERLDIDIMNGKTVMPLRSMFPNSTTVYRVRNRTSLVTFTLPNGDKYRMEIASGATCSEVKKALIAKVDPNLKMSDISLFSPSGKIRKNSKMRNELSETQFHFVMNKQKVDIEVESSQKTYHLKVSPTSRVVDVKSKLKEKGADIDESFSTDLKYKGRILRNESFMFDVVYSQEKSKFYLGM